MRVVVWEDKQDMHILMNMHRSPVAGNFCNEHGKAKKPVTVRSYINKGDIMANSSSIS
jgi:hypothetical protein